MSAPTLLTPHGYSSSTCGYCSPAGTKSSGPSSKKYGMVAPQMSCQFYQNLIDRGWRRSGDYVYHPDMAKTCCPQYTIRLDVKAFMSSKKHRQTINRWNRYLSTGHQPGEGGGETDNGKEKGKGKGKGKEKAMDIFAELRESEAGFGGEGSKGKHRYKTLLTPAKATAETFELYKRYQIAIHHDPPEKVEMKGFRRFLCDSPLLDAPISYSSTSNTDHLPKTYGSYHLLYRVNGTLIGISVIDILPNCVSSVYFIWDPDWAWASLGKLSALREMALVKDMMEAGALGMGWLYMGYWIPDCVKMRYKSEYSPSYLLDPGTHVFHPLTSQLDGYLQAHSRGYHPFESILKQSSAESSQYLEIRPNADVLMDPMEPDSESDDEELDDFPSTPIPGFAGPDTISERDLEELMVVMQNRGIFGSKKGSRVVQFGDLQFLDQKGVTSLVRELVAAVGLDLMARPGEGNDKGFIYFE